MERYLTLAIKKKKNRINIDVYEPETGEHKIIESFYSPDGHPRFDEELGKEIYSWIQMWDEMED